MTALARFVGTCSFVALTAFASAQQPASPQLSRPERNALQAIVRAVEANAPGVALRDGDWPIHLLRASDGSHYVAFSIDAGDTVRAGSPMVLYVRLSTRRDAATGRTPERSVVAEWLAGQAPSPVLPRRGIAIGDMPTYGAAGITTRGNVPSQNLQLLELERERAKEKREADARARKAALEGGDVAPVAYPPLPFEDFDARATADADGSGAVVIRRSLTAGPGDYELTVGWVNPTASNITSAVRIARRPLTLPPASTSAFALSTVIVADEVRVRETPIPAAEQAAHPYSFGPTEITPARDYTLTTEERLALVVQVINARGTSAGKPDVVVAFRVLHKNTAGEELMGTLAPQFYNAETLPADFDIAKGHPIFAAVAVPLRTFKRGTYRLEVVANDRVAGALTSADVAFDVIATPATLLRDAPRLTRRFERGDLLTAPVLAEITARLRSSSPSPALLDALARARDRQFVDLVRDDGGDTAEAGARATLRVLARYAIGDTPASLNAPLSQAEHDSAPPAATSIIRGALRALEGNDREALSAWDAAVSGGASPVALTPLVVHAALRLGDTSRALATARQALKAGTTEPAVTPYLAAALIAAGQHADALRILDPHLMTQPDDRDAQWLALHALFSGFASGEGPGSDDAGRARLAQLASQYVAEKGPHAALAREWLLALEKR